MNPILLRFVYFHRSRGRVLALPGYRHYRLDGAGKINRAEWLDAPNDEEAIAQVRKLRLGAPSEIWNGNRLVARVDASSKRSR
ncbi:MAG TPA: hypothetical protein VHN55_02570 [Sphingomicrobium sp.]|nr:hypothetical protein [Sphingomicrobium sp.]